MTTESEDKLWMAITLVLNDRTASDKEKLKRIQAYLDVYDDLGKRTLGDME